MAENKKKTSGDGDWGWPLIILSFCFGLWPIGLVLLFGKLFTDDEKKPAQKAPPLQGTAGPAGAAAAPKRQTKAAKAVKKVTKSPQAKKSNVWWLKIIGLIALFFGLNATGDGLSSTLWAIQNGVESFWWLEDLLSGLALTAGGGAMLYSGFAMDRQLKRFSKYLLVLGDREAMPIDELARTLGYSERRVEKDLEKMIDKGYFGGKAYLNVELGYLFRGGNAAETAFRRRFEEAQEAAEEPRRQAAPKEAEEGYSGILRNIRRANDQIADPILSAKIDRLEEITAKIFKAVEEDPRKKDRIGTFLNYYLPTTQKLLDSYAQFESAGVEGDNLRQAKERIENTMDSIVKGFEHQLDELYQADAMDVDSDIRVMEHMLRRDTGSAAEDFGLGGGAVQTGDE
nr:5-bromo-4-chloroindolyl phosphate hydrolysis family protein [uncultured Oscillibacter sp.]